MKIVGAESRISSIPVAILLPHENENCHDKNDGQVWIGAIGLAQESGESGLKISARRRLDE